MNRSDRAGALTRPAFVVVALVVALLLSIPAAATAVNRIVRGPHAAQDAAKPFFDSRVGDRRAGKGGRPSASQRSARARLRSRLGRQAVIDVDRLTGTVRSVLRLDGALSGPAEGDRSAVALAWVRANRSALGLTAADVDGLELAARVVTRGSGITHLRYRQAYRGVPAFDNGVRVNLDRGGRILNVTGSPLSRPRVASIAPRLGAADALRALQRNVGVRRPVKVVSGPSGVRRGTRFSADEFARLVLFGTAAGARLAWHLTYQATSVAYYDAVVDATTGAILYRQNLTKFNSDATVFPNYPGAEEEPPPKGGPGAANQPRTIELETAGNGGPPWITAVDDQLQGPYTHVYSDIDDDNSSFVDPDAPTPVDDEAEVVRRNAQGTFVYPFTEFAAPPGYDNACDFTTPDEGWPDPLARKARCSWDPTQPTSWLTNRRQTAVQAFYFANRFHDHLENPNIDFQDTDGGFGGDGAGNQADYLRLEANDGAATAPNGGPDGDHLNNANMSTPPDGLRPRMQNYLVAYDPDAFFTFRDVNGDDDAATVWHEYVHGLSNRLVISDDGSGALSTPHGGAMGEAWSDWYALDLLHRDGLEFDDPERAGEVDIGMYWDARFTSTRFEPIDCPPTTTAPHCPGGISTGPGGYTFGDFGKVFFGPEVHSDGEIWMQVLWDLRSALIRDSGDDIEGSDLAEALVTEGMRLSPPEPSFLDMRNSILAAETGIGGGDLRDLVWSVFAGRGMGFFASVRDSSDIQPIENFNVPPDPDTPKGRAAGTVTSADSGLPLPGATIGFGGLSTDPTFPDHLATTSGPDGSYALDAPAGSYGSLVFQGDAGFDAVALDNIVVRPGQTTTNDVALRRDWAAASGGGEVLHDDAKYDDTGGVFGCGLDQLIDQSQGAGWSPFNPNSEDPDNPHIGPPTAVIVLPQAIDVSAFGLDPSNTCGDDPTAMTKDFRIETSADGTTFNVAKEGSFTEDQRARLNIVTPDANASGVRYVRLTLLSPQSAEEGDSGRDFIDFSEIEVFGGPPNALPSGTLSATPATVDPGEAVHFDASSFSDPDSKITGYDWDFDGDGTVDQTTDAPQTDFAYASAGSFTAKVAVKDFRGGAGAGAAGVTVNGPPATPQPTDDADLSMPRSGRNGRVRLGVDCAEACMLTFKMKLTGAQGRALGIRRRTLTTFSRSITETGLQRITVRVPRRARAAARRHDRKSVVVTISVRARYADGRDEAARRTLRIRL